MEPITRQDLEVLRSQIVQDVELLMNAKDNENEIDSQFEWLRSKKIRKLMDISPATLQNFRISGKIRHKKIMGSYYYNKTDLINLFEDER
ncbi:DNA-binding protein [Chryseobacterium flavum]|uniref:DNA-binding protein n=1 Tax=Chryseobacterium flavum TaxID=415851 RepID=A0A3D9CMB6_9FLAO|nr:helix-turn-helix domain-containing protein [Chryseobacterium flavum]REC66854.1 DNA-binding protein [Chryseobacterium flavum]